MRIFMLTSDSTFDMLNLEAWVTAPTSIGATAGAINRFRVPLVVRENLTNRDLPVNVRLHPAAAEAGLILSAYKRYEDTVEVYLTAVKDLASIEKGSPLLVVSIYEPAMGRKISGGTATVLSSDEPSKPTKRGKKKE